MRKLLMGLALFAMVLLSVAAVTNTEAVLNGSSRDLIMRSSF